LVTADFDAGAAGLRCARRANCGAASVGIVATLNTPTPTHAKNRLLSILGIS
jgi:hypothetical protein